MMEQILTPILNSPYFGLALSAAAFYIGVKVQQKTRLAIFNSLLVSIVVIISFLLIFHIPYEAYHQGGAIINMLLAPATACLAVSIYNQLPLLKANWLPIIAGCTVGSITSMASVWALCRFFGLNDQMLYSMLPKSVTTPIGISIASAHDGIVSVTLIMILITGIFGNICAPLFIKLFHVDDPVAAGLSIGACSHAMGTSKAIELGETEGAMSGLAIGICGVITVIFSMLL